MIHRPPNQHGSFVALICLIGLLISCDRVPSVHFNIIFDPTRPDRLDVSAEIGAPPRDGLIFRGYGFKEMLRVSDFRATSPDGSLLRVTSSFETIMNGQRTASVPLFKVEGPLPSVVNIRYTVIPGSREGNSHTGYTGRSYGFAGESFVFLTGRGLFLMPEGADKLKRISVRFTLPKGWEAVTPWNQAPDATAFQAGIVGPAEGPGALDWPIVSRNRTVPAAEHLISGVVGLGRFRTRSFVIGRTTFRLAFESSTPKAEEDRATAQIETVARFIHDIFGRGLGPSYIILAAPKTPTGDEISGESWSTGQGQTLVPLTPSRLYKFAQQLINAYVRYVPYRTVITRKEEYWLADALRSYYAWRALEQTGVVPPDDVTRLLSVSYLSSLHVRGLQRNLEAIHSSAEPRRVEREEFAPFILACLDHELRATGSIDGLDGVIRRMFAGPRAPSLWSILPEPHANRWSGFRNRFVRGGADILPVDQFYQMPPTRPSTVRSPGEIVRWLTFIYTGRTDGYLENCGCKANQSGGVARRATVIQRILQNEPEAILLDAGDSFIRPEKQGFLDFLALEEQGLYLRTLDLMRYRAAAVAINELTFGLDHFRRMTRDLSFPYLAANIKAGNAPVAIPSILLVAGRTRIAVIGIFDPPLGPDSRWLFEEHAAGLQIEDPIVSIKREALAIRDGADFIVVIGRLTPATIRAVARNVPGIDMIISSEYYGPIVEPGPDGTIHREDHPGFVDGLLVAYTHLTSYGLHTVRVGLDRSGKIAAADFRNHWLDDRVPDSPLVRNRLNRFYDRVGRQVAAQESVRPLFADDPVRLTGRYAGASHCAKCHESEHAQWLTTGHASAYKTLLDRHRHFQPKCVSCHVVGYGTPHGFKLGRAEGTLANVQCEVCHGPGAEHAESPSPANIRRQVPAEVCLECHNPEHSDQFVYASRLPRVVHKSVD